MNVKIALNILQFASEMSDWCALSEQVLRRGGIRFGHSEAEESKRACKSHSGVTQRWLKAFTYCSDEAQRFLNASVNVQHDTFI